MNDPKGIIKLLIMVLLIVAIPTTIVHAEDKQSTYSVVSAKDTLNNEKGDAIAEISYERLVLKGETKAVKKINQSIKNDCIRFFTEYEDTLFEYAQIDYDHGTLRDMKYQSTCVTKVTYQENNVISLKITFSWYAGGVSNNSSYGLTYDLKTGKKLSITEVAQGSSSEIKGRIVTATEKYLNNLTDTSWSKEEIKTALDKVKSYKISDFKYYLKGNKVYICFDQYELIGNYYGGNIVSINIK